MSESRPLLRKRFFSSFLEQIQKDLTCEVFMCTIAHSNDFESRGRRLPHNVLQSFAGGCRWPCPDCLPWGQSMEDRSSLVWLTWLQGRMPQRTHQILFFVFQPTAALNVALFVRIANILLDGLMNSVGCSSTQDFNIETHRMGQGLTTSNVFHSLTICSTHKVTQFCFKWFLLFRGFGSTTT